MVTGKGHRFDGWRFSRGVRRHRKAKNTGHLGGVVLNERGLLRTFLQDWPVCGSTCLSFEHLRARIELSQPNGTGSLPLASGQVGAVADMQDPVWPFGDLR